MINIDKLCEALREEDLNSSYVLWHAKIELKTMLESEDEMSRLMAEQLLELLAVFSTHGHSGMTAPYAIRLFTLLANHKPLGPLTGEDAEWIELGYNEETFAQNRRCSHIFKRADGTAYNSQAVVFEEPDGSRYLTIDSRRDITFPYEVPDSPEVIKRA